ncbi:hypothetical protein HDU79_009672 [Rhizoclosmatium sp. JEL0117]|nr:hypothetical protein HDU79_009672 [Rhizoclosmatium sp. JEL0117]
MSDAAGKGKIPSNRQVLRFLNGMEEWSNDVENVDSDDDGEDAGDGWKWSRESLDVGKAWLQSLKLVREFLQNKNEGELLQNMMENIRIGAEKDRGGFDDEDDDREERFGSGYGNGGNGKDDEVVPAIIEVIKLLAQGLVNPGSLGQIVAVLKVISDTFVGVSENGGNDADEAKPARYEEASSSSGAAEHTAEDQQKAKGPPSLPQKASADEITPAASGSESSAPQVSSATDARPLSKKPTRQLDAIAQKHLTALMRDMTAQVLPPGLFPATSVTPSSASTTPPKPQLSRLAKVLNPRAADSTESRSADDANTEEDSGFRENAKEWFNALFIDSDGSFVIKEAFSRDFTKGILPSLLADFKTIIIRDLTYEENNVKYEMEDLEIDLSSMLPHLCRVNIENGVLFGFNNMIKMETTNKVSVEFYQIHMNIMNVPFKMRRGNKHVEQGNMSVKIDKHGITVLIELEWAAPSQDARDTVYKLVDVKTVKVTVQNLSVKITGTKHDGIYAAFGNKVLARRISDEIKRGSEMEIRKAIEKWNEVLPKFVTRVGGGWNSKVDGARGLGA